MGLFYKPSSWLLLILSNDTHGIKTDVETNLIRAAQITEQDTPEYEVQFLDISKTREFPRGFTSENEIEEEFNEKILNDLISRKKKSAAKKVALIMERNAFPTNEIFESVIKEINHDDSIYHLICSKGNFLETEQRKKCYRFSCAKCQEALCEHSCLLRLLWVIFEDKRVLNVLDGEKTNY
jgi:hypothetical protein